MIQHITFHLSDSLPKDAIERMHQELELLPEDRRDGEKRKYIQGLLDSGLGTCILNRTDCARIVEDSLLFGDGARYRLLAWVVMPNHVHALIEQLTGWPLGKMVQSWKRHTTREISRLELACPAPPNPGTPSPGAPNLGASNLGAPSCTRQNHSKTTLWQRDYWDRYIRNEQHFLTVKRYIEHNPVKAGLVDSPEKWAWGSAWMDR
ncbi:MAG: transposase [Gammaproteobacteria bacterium]|nr:transposase [Gammaproteobacteria bacterium]